MAYAEVAVNAPGGHRHAFTYSVPASLNIVKGSGVWVPFGSKVLRGIVINFTDIPSVAETKAISALINGFSAISAERIQLAQWIAEHYIAPIFSAVELMLPPGFASMKEIKPRRITLLELNPDREQIQSAITELTKNRAFKQVAILEYLKELAIGVTLRDIKQVINCGSNVVKALIIKGLIVEKTVDISRDSLAGREFPMEFPFTFTNEQQSTWHKIKSSIIGRSGPNGSKPFLLHGVTGSGKTEIYLQAVHTVIKQGKKAICLVPEISLTPQVIGRFNGRFPGKVALLHSRLSQGEQSDIWQGIIHGDYDIVVGPRSAIFAPLKNLGLIIVDEEHEWAYKQSDKIPRYNARDVSVKLAELTGATLILGSATPSIESYYKAQRSEYQLVELKERVTLTGISTLPEVTFINMRNELKSGNRGIFSIKLKSKIEISLKNEEQVLLYINRRGLASFIECMDCGYVPSCTRCSVSLTYHSINNRMICHHCRRSYPIIKNCPRCSSNKIKYLGIGTERVEAECKKLFPSAKTIRFDSDVITGAKDYEIIVNKFRKHEADILVGTQMVAKGMDFPLVSLVGVINADIGLNLPDFRAGERTFQLLCQVAGRAGRGIFAGTAIVQTFNPDYYAIKYAAQHDYLGFYRTEIQYRRSYGYPPLNDMVRLVYSNSNDLKCQQEAERVHKTLKNEIAARGLNQSKLIGPMTGYITRLRGRYQMQIILLGRDLISIINNVYLPRGWMLDVDPVGMI
jgi:primosomal protein N' (replication factor Y) (superfamily II helicase)